MSDSCSSGPLRAWVVVLPHSNDDGDRVELIEVEAPRIPASKAHRSTYDWFMADHWAGNADECFWDAADAQKPGEYVVSFHIEGAWTYSSNGDDYDEELIVDKIEAVDLGAFAAMTGFKGVLGMTEEEP